MTALNQRCLDMQRNSVCLLLTNLVNHMLRFDPIKRRNLDVAA